MTYQLLLNADQKSYIQLSLSIVTIILNTIFAIALMKMGASVHIVKLVTAFIFILRPLGQMLYVNKHYKIDSKIKYVDEPIKQKWNGFSQHLASVICQNIDVVVLTMFSTLKNVSIYSVYYIITSGVEQIVMTAATGLEALFGNMIANGEKKKLLKVFSVVEWIVHTGVTFIFTIAMITIVPFITIYTKGITDANYIEPLFGTLLVIAYGAECLRVPYFRVIKAAGHFKETQNGAFISAGLNVVITVILVFKLGLIGVALGTLIAMIYHTIYFVLYLSNNILYRPVYIFLKYLITDVVVIMISYMLTKGFMLCNESYLAWVILAIKVAIVVFLVTLIVNVIIYKKQMINMLSFFKRKKSNLKD